MIILENICKKYGETVVFDNFNLTLPKNKTFCIMGQSGKGKTTLVRMLMGLEKPDSGNILGLEDFKASAVFQEDRLCENLDVYANIVLPHLHKDSFVKMTKKHIDIGLFAVGLADYGNKKISTLSGGMKRRVAILRAIYADFDILILDEPFKGLDDETKLKTIEYVKSQTKGKTVLYITHDKIEASIMHADMHINL